MGINFNKPNNININKNIQENFNINTNNANSINKNDNKINNIQHNYHHPNQNLLNNNYAPNHQLLPSVDKIIKEKHGTETWGYQVLPSLYSVYQKVVVINK